MRSRINTWYCWVWSIGVADIATQNQPFVALVASVIPFQANPSHFFAVFDSLVAITTHPGAKNSRSGRFRVNDDDDNDNNNNNNRRTKRLLNSLLRMRARGNNNNNIASYIYILPQIHAAIIIQLPQQHHVRLLYR